MDILSIDNFQKNTIPAKNNYNYNKMTNMLKILIEHKDGGFEELKTIGKILEEKEITKLLLALYNIINETQYNEKDIKYIDYAHVKLTNLIVRNVHNGLVFQSVDCFDSDREEMIIKEMPKLKKIIDFKTIDMLEKINR